MQKSLKYFTFLWIIFSCQPSKTSVKTMKKHLFTNALINETSPYLLQHAHNPVNWEPWSNDIFNKAREQNKLVLISIGYSACHWCHVMEKESFEDTSVAKIMNDHFICVKIDREEHPDIDQIYMDAVQLMTGNGGWPLNCITLPDGRPVYGGTYFPKNQWKKILTALSEEYKQNPEKFEEYARKVTEGVRLMDLVPETASTINREILDTGLMRWKKLFDNEWGGNKGAPKFPMPVNVNFLLQYAFLTNDTELHTHIKTTLNRMAQGGIYDQVEGGFMRYSTDAYWKVPHFEKMLYDNAQLTEVYAKAYRAYGKKRYIDIVKQTFDFLTDNFKSPEGGYYSAYDADSEGEEGKFYTWTPEELKAVLDNNQWTFVQKVFQIHPSEKWENRYILWQKQFNSQLAGKLNMPLEKFEQIRSEIIRKLHTERNKRIKPALDNKILTSWNALLISGLTNAYQATGDTRYLQEAQHIFSFIENQYLNKKTLALVHLKGIDANLDDYALFIRATIDLYQATFDSSYLLLANDLTGYVNQHFSDENGIFYYFTSEEKSKQLIVRKKELSDNVIPSSNAVMAHNLHYLSLVMEQPAYARRAEQMSTAIQSYVAKVPSAYACWASVMAKIVFPFNEVIITGKNALDYQQQLTKKYIPNTLWAGSRKPDNQIPALQHRSENGKTLIYICRNKTCKKPLNSPQEALQTLVY